MRSDPELPRSEPSVGPGAEQLLLRRRVLLAMALGAAVGAGGLYLVRSPGAADRNPPDPVGLTIDLNQDDAARIELLPGVGTALAQAIVAWRTQHGPFHSLQDLEQVPGIGPALIREVSPHVRFSDEAPGGL